jgi:hypothetical protein
MKATSRWRAWHVIVLGALLLTTTGCGQMARQALKDGIFSFVSGSVGSGLISAQFADLVSSIFTTGGGFVFR